MKRSLAFGEFRLDIAERLLVHQGEIVPLTPKVFDTLLLLLENAGHLVEKDEFMKQLWPDTFVGDDALAQNISLLRKALGEGNVSSALIVTIPRRGYRFAGTVQELLEPLQGAEEKNSKPAPQTTAERLSTQTFLQEQVEIGEHETGGQALGERSEAGREVSAAPRSMSSGLRLGGMRLVVVAIGAGLLAGLLTYALLSPTRVPRVIRTTQITNSGRVDPWGRLISDGSRIYFLEREGDHWNLAQTSLGGGETQIVAAPFRNTLLLDLSPDRSEFLISSFVYRGTQMPLWTWPVQGGPPTPVGNLIAYDAAWHPNGRQIVYAKDDGVYLADRDGSHARMFAPTRGQPFRLARSPDGKLLRFSVPATGVPGSSLWEIGCDGTHLHELLPHWSNPPVECCGSWSHDGSFFFFGSSHGGSSGLWALREKGSFFGGRQAEPYELTAGDPAFEAPPMGSADGHKLYAFGSSLKFELVSYAPKSRQFTTILPGSRASYLTYSRDGEWTAYITAPDGTLWRAKRDGSLRNPLTSSSIHAGSPAWSPDAKQIAFLDQTLACQNRIYLISAENGTPRELFPNRCEQIDPAWSPDGRTLTFARRDTLPSGGSAATTIEVLDLATNQVSTFPGSQGLRAPSWSPDGRFMAAMAEDYHRLMLFDVPAKKWTQLSPGVLLNGALKWSRDGAFLYFQDLLAPNQAVYRVRLRDGKREEVVNFESYIRAGVPRCGFVDLAPDGSLIVSLLRNHADIYALDLDIP